MPPAMATLGIHELDDQMIGKFSFNNRDSVLKILSTSGGLENLQVSLMAEVCWCVCVFVCVCVCACVLCVCVRVCCVCV